jgi:hypothetical protein
MLLTIVLVPMIISNDTIVQSELPEQNTGIYKTKQNEFIEVTKLIRNQSGQLVDDYYTYIGQNISVVIEITNNSPEDITNVALTSPEANISQMNPSYQDEWFTFYGSVENNWTTTVLSTGASLNLTYNMTVHEPRQTYEFTPSNVTFIWVGNSSKEYSLSNLLTFHVYAESPKVRVEKSLIIREEETIDGRIAVNYTFTIQIRLTNYYYGTVSAVFNDTVFQSAPTNFTYSGEDSYYSLRDIPTGASDLLQYEVVGKEFGEFELDTCVVNATLPDDSFRQFSSNRANVTIYKPIYDGNNWSKKVPLLSVEKYFQIEGEQYISYEMFNNSISTVTVIINITNNGIVDAYDLFITEQEYSNWVFDTVGIETWYVAKLAYGESASFNYTITPKILGTFTIEPTKIEYGFTDQFFIENVTGYVTYSDIIEITLKEYIPVVQKTQQWWIAIGISIGVLTLSGIPLAVTFYTYRKRRKTQKGM